MKKTVFITGSTGTMGMETLKKFMENKEEFHVRVLVRDSEKNHKKLEPYAADLEILWGDLQDDEVLKAGVKGADYVLHIGALVSPHADARPKDAMRINYGSTLSMLRSIKELGQTETTHFVYVGTVAQTGDRMPPIHWGRVGDPMKPSIYDYYALSKVCSEYAVMESGLKYWASIRQTGQLPSQEGAGDLPIQSHYSYNAPLEYSDAEDSGNLMRNICLNAPEKFWRKAYNLSGGISYRLSMFELFMKQGIADPREMFEPKWMSTHNFHGHFYLDADELEAIVPFRTKTLDECMAGLNAKAAEGIKMAMEADPNFHFPTIAELKENTRKAISKPGGVLQFVADNDEERIKVWFGSREKYEAISNDWEDHVIYQPLNLPNKPLSRGFDETKPVEELDLEDMRQAAAFRGGKCLSDTMKKGDLYTPLKWICADGHEFEACPYTILFAGHWCPDCLSGEWRYFDIAKKNPFFNQVWEPLHKDEESFRVKMIVDGKSIEELYK